MALALHKLRTLVDNTRLYGSTKNSHAFESICQG
jgi:hypothetical protein